MFELDKITRNNIKQLNAYSSARDEYKGIGGVMLDANENPYGTLNRYPDPYQKALKAEVFRAQGIPTKNTFIGNGSDEVIDLLFRIFCIPKVDKALTFSPSYGMYDVSAAINDIELVKVELNEEFDIDYQSVSELITDPKLKLIIICAPNNPTGNSPDQAVVERIVKNFKGVVLIDEAYGNFSNKKSFTTRIKRFPNIVVSQTMSKAWGLAAARIGFAFANEKIIGLLNKVKPPYNISGLNQSAAITCMRSSKNFLQNKARILENKKQLYAELKKNKIVRKVFHSETNFFLVEFENADKTYNCLAEKNIIVRNRNSLLRNCIRITVGTPLENELLIQALKSI
jgi:histidinol-phosphate aminotransferase